MHYTSYYTPEKRVEHPYNRRESFFTALLCVFMGITTLFILMSTLAIMDTNRKLSDISAALKEGNSLRSEMVTAIEYNTAATERVSIPIESLRDLIKDGYDKEKGIWVDDSHGWLGITYAAGEATADDESIKGVVIVSVEKDSPAEKCGLKVGDLIVAADDTRIEDMEGMASFMYKTSPGDEVVFSVIREYGEEKYTAVLK